MTFDYSTAPPEYAEARRAVFRALHALTRAADPIPTAVRTERAVRDALVSFTGTAGQVDGTRSQQIVVWRDLLTRAVLKDAAA